MRDGTMNRLAELAPALLKRRRRPPARPGGGHLRPARARPTEKGQSFVELAVSLVLLLVLLAGTVDLGRMLYIYITMRDAAQEGVVFGSAFPTHCDQTVDRVVSNLVDPGTVDVEVYVADKACNLASRTTEACTGNEIRVRVIDYDFPITMPFLGTFLGRQTIVLETEVSGTILRPPCTGGP